MPNTREHRIFTPDQLHEPDEESRVSAYFRQWLAPPTIIAIVVAVGAGFVTYYRVDQNEKAIARVEASLQYERAASTATYERRDVLNETLKSLDTKIDMNNAAMNARLARIEAALGVR